MTNNEEWSQRKYSGSMQKRDPIEENVITITIIIVK